MAKEERIYQKLTRPVAGLASYSSLWLGPGHLLLVKSSGYTEEYVRFQFSDIQAFVVGPSSRRLYWSIAWGVLAAAFMLPAVAALLDHERPIASSIGLLLMASFWAINHFRGPSCRVFLVTRVQTIKLPIVRRRKLDKIVARVQPLIEEAQADLRPPIEAPQSMAPPTVT